MLGRVSSDVLNTTPRFKYFRVFSVSFGKMETGFSNDQLGLKGLVLLIIIGMSHCRLHQSCIKSPFLYGLLPCLFQSFFITSQLVKAVSVEVVCGQM